MTEDEELQELEARPDEAQQAAAVAAFEAFEEEWRRELDYRPVRGGRVGAQAPPLGRAGKGHNGRVKMAVGRP